jgi:hypothetical protein
MFIMTFDLFKVDIHSRVLIKREIGTEKVITTNKLQL